MTIEKLIELLKQYPPTSTVTVWHPFHDKEWSAVVVHEQKNGNILIEAANSMNSEKTYGPI